MMVKKYIVFLLLSISVLIFLGCDSPWSDNAGSKASDIETSPARELLRQSHEFFRRGRFSEALQLVDTARERDPDLPDVYYIRGLILDKMKRNEEARESFQKVLSLQSEYPGAHFQLGNLMFRAEEFRRAVNHYQGALDYYSSEIDLYSKPDIYLNLGLTYSKLGVSDSVRWAYQEAVVADSSFAPAYILIGQEYRKDAEYQKALTYTRKALELEPENISYKSILGSVLFQMGELERALAYLEEVISERPWEYKAHFQLGRTLIGLGHTERGQRHLSRADTLRTIQSQIIQLQYNAMQNPDSLMLWVELGESFYRIGHLEQARDVLEVALSLEPNNPALQNNLASLLAETGDMPGAISRYQDILAQDSTISDVWFNLGSAYAHQGEIDSARDAWIHLHGLTQTHLPEEAFLDSLMDEI
ncbi:MAG TPA: tetratricopeptide repeat protein [bacterium]|nr:tetratricopeptide repeat protein [bacterium]